MTRPQPIPCESPRSHATPAAGTTTQLAPLRHNRHNGHTPRPLSLWCPPGHCHPRRGPAPSEVGRPPFQNPMGRRCKDPEINTRTTLRGAPLSSAAPGPTYRLRLVSATIAFQHNICGVAHIARNAQISVIFMRADASCHTVLPFLPPQRTHQRSQSANNAVRG